MKQRPHRTSLPRRRALDVAIIALISVVVGVSLAVVRNADSDGGSEQPRPEADHERFGQPPYYDVYDDFERPDSDLAGSRTPRGQLVWRVRNEPTTGPGPARIEGGKYRFRGPGRSYAQLDLGSLPHELTATWTFQPGAPRGGVVVMLSKDDDLSLFNLVHPAIYPTGWILSYTTSGPSGLVPVSHGRFDPPLVADGRTVHQLRVLVHDDTVTLVLPDGKRRTVRHVGFGAAGGQYAIWEAIQPRPKDAEARFDSIGAARRARR